MIRFDFESRLFKREKLALQGYPHEEWVVRGNRRLFEHLPKAFAGIRRISVIGWGSQGPAQARNLRDSLAGSDIQVCVGLREGSSSREKARAVGFSEDNGTLLEMMEAVRTSELVILLISDAAQARLYRQIFDALRPGATLGLSHGFLLGYLQSIGERFPENINVIGVCPKGMGPSVRRLYEQGRTQDGGGINTSIAVEQDVDGRATDYALGWSIALGAPFSFMTSLEMEYRSDIFGERAILLGAVHGVIERIYRRFVEQDGMTPEEAFLNSAESITGPISHTISHHGLMGVYEGLADEATRAEFARVYNAVYEPAYILMSEIYEEVASRNEIRSVVLSGERLSRYPMNKIDNTPMWQVGERVRAARASRAATPIHPLTAGVYVALMTAQADLLLANNHPFSEVVNESIIESVDSLNPYMHFRGVAYMVDNCSTTARLGARKWAPRFDYMLYQSVFPLLDASPGGKQEDAFARFRANPVHEMLAKLLNFRPKFDIAVTG